MAQLQVSGLCRQSELVKVFGQNRKRLNRAMNQLRDHGISSFFKKRGGRRGGTVLTPEVKDAAELLFTQGESRRDVSKALKVDYSTLSKAISDGRLTETTTASPTASTKTERSQQDFQAAQGMGTACLRTDERLLAAFGKIDGVLPVFESSVDLPYGGVLCALPALLENGLLHKIDVLGDIHGYYTKVQIIQVLAIMYLCRFMTIEQLQGAPPGEIGKLIGLDRIPEARCLRGKTKELSQEKKAENWAAELSALWMKKYPDTTGFLYVDGHIKAYGGKIDLPKRYVSRQRLCLSGISYYWVNDAIGQPFFVVECQIDHGMLEALRTKIIPRLIRDIPNQPTDAQLEADPLLYRFIIVFDREGCSPAFFKEVWNEHRIACLTYKKNKSSDWDETEFCEVQGKTQRGEPFQMELAERITTVGSNENIIEVKEVRKLCESGKQTVIITTAKSLDIGKAAVYMFARWGQENFFAYAMHHFAIDKLTAYGKEIFGDPETVTNPKWRSLTTTRRRLTSHLKELLLKQDRMDSHKGADPNHKSHEKWIVKKSDILETIKDVKDEIENVKKAVKDIDQHILWKDLPEKEKFSKLPTARRSLLNTVGMICYRAETAMASVLAEEGLSFSQSRAILQDLFVASVDIKPDYQLKNLNIYVHSAPTRKSNLRLSKLLEHLTQTETLFPGTDMKLVYHSVACSVKNEAEGTFEIP